MTITISNTRSDYIILATNRITNNTVGTNLYMKTRVITLNGNANNDASWNNIFSTLNNNNKYKNRIILSGKIRTSTNPADPSFSFCLITKNNIKNNMKYIFDSSNNKNGKLAFVKNLDIQDNSSNYLFNDLSNQRINNNNNTTNNDNRYIYHLNYYFSNSDIYKIYIGDYLYKYSKDISNNNLLTANRDDISYSAISYNITNIYNTFTFINTTIDNSNVINFNSNNFNKLLIDNSNTTNTTNLTILNKNTSYPINRNIFSYNKLTLDYKHINYYDISFSFSNTNSIDSYNTNTIQTFLIKTNTFNTLQNIKRSSKIIFSLKNIYLNNLKVLDLDINNNFYRNIRKINNISTTLRSIKDASNIIFIGLGNQLTGITQHDIYNHVHFSTNSNKKWTIKLKKDINTSNINTDSRFEILRTSLDKYYLLDIPLNYTNTANTINTTNTSHNINNTISYNNILYNNIEDHASKIFNLNFNSYFNALNNNYLKNNFNTLASINNVNNIYANYAQVNSAINIKFKNIIQNPDTIRMTNRIELAKNIFPQNSDNGYDLRFNYNKYFFVSNYMDIVLALNPLSLINNYFIDNYGYGYGLLNFYSYVIGNYVKTSKGSDFTNVDCLYIYHDPITDSDERFRYPNNNIEIKTDTEIDTLASAIEQFRGTGARTSTTNVAFIPGQNGSNLSRKMIQGIIGLNNIPKLLSIQPYDPDIIIGRGFINQYQITDNCTTSDCDKITAKQNAIKHESVKSNKLFSSNSVKKQNYANIVRSTVRNKVSQQQQCNIPCTSVNKYTPFTLFGRGKGKYLGP